MGSKQSLSDIYTIHRYLGEFKMASNDNNQINAAREQVNEVLDVMRNNVNKVMERDGKLNELDSRASNLENSSLQFSTTARRVRKKMWWENFKMKICIGGVVIVLLIVIIVVIVMETKKSDNGNDDGAKTTTQK